MLKLFKVIVLILLLSFSFVLITEVFTVDVVYPEYLIKTEECVVTSSKSVLIQDPNSLIPVQYQGMLDFDTIPDEIRKSVFINYMLPSIVLEHDRLINRLNHIEYIENRMNNKINLNDEDFQFLWTMMKNYNANTIKELKIKLFPHHISLVLAQAALESGWGTSKVFSKANNPFGIMSSSPDEPRMRVLVRESNTEFYFHSYHSIYQAVEHYYSFISRISSYEKFRKKRWERVSPFALVKLLKGYHETPEYSNLIESIIRRNDLEKYDHITINKNYVLNDINYKMRWKKQIDKWFKTS